SMTRWKPLWTLIPGSRLDADHPENGVLIPCRNTRLILPSFFGPDPNFFFSGRSWIIERFSGILFTGVRRDFMGAEDRTQIPILPQGLPWPALVNAIRIALDEAYRDTTPASSLLSPMRP
ncbi:hypothetical protein, partial [Bradyrhizobium sp. 147]|uniref:hypothetical protein n=1 Tax=Bradyrhizobium sp. 147 TaxID=2782623 RepID=UPI001FF8E130